MDATPRWLNPEEKLAWESFIRMQETLIGRLSRLIQADSGMSASDYAVLVNLTESDGGRMRLLELAKRVEWEKSRMSHQVSRMIKRGLVAREECPDDGRGAFVVATPAGYEAIEEAAPMHVEHVRRLFIDALTPNQLSTFARLTRRVSDHMEKQPD
ncbi:MarR family winged helix-turn-helix transcriptional regulator [Actinomadura sp. WMMB 499]|uniref:MarR family winged helix-turn-helix transcriptional regulator n=1 Tax=Actinomadura sp. WMMB 499 TaxID=1219491 RepID=UPI00124546C2|nr:MarR family winged helix-turn-helix transcriptional regulator [Actinomadura sp. WMMB 499]QFG23650.1 winged helix-turn-helix transcriptional regulator [Actinomadura sp. WMMB 499]